MRMALTNAAASRGTAGGQGRQDRQLRSSRCLLLSSPIRLGRCMSVGPAHRDRRGPSPLPALAVSGMQAVLTDVGRALKGWDRADSIRISHHRLEDVQSPDVNVAHVRRTLPDDTMASLTALECTPFSEKVVIHDSGDSMKLQIILDHHIPDRNLGAFLHEDIMQLHRSFTKITGCCCASVRLDWVHSTMCPRLHVDNVPLRMLVTYVGAGTLYAENAAVERSKLLVPPEAPGNDTAIRPGYELKQTAPGDVLLLKGNSWPENKGCGAIHRSPHDVSDSVPRLVLTIDYAS